MSRYSRFSTQKMKKSISKAVLTTKLKKIFSHSNPLTSSTNSILKASTRDPHHIHKQKVCEDHTICDVLKKVRSKQTFFLCCTASLMVECRRLSVRNFFTTSFGLFIFFSYTKFCCCCWRKIYRFFLWRTFFLIFLHHFLVNISVILSSSSIQCQMLFLV